MSHVRHIKPDTSASTHSATHSATHAATSASGARSALVLCALLLSSVAAAETVQPTPAMAPPAAVAETRTAVIPELSADTEPSGAGASSVPAPSGPLRTSPNAPVGVPADAAAAPTPPSSRQAPPLALTGQWMGFEIIVFERPGVGLDPGGEVLRIDQTPVLPAIGTGAGIGLDPAGTRGAVGYPPAQHAQGVDAPMEDAAAVCSLLPAGIAPNPEDPLTRLFAAPPRAETLAALTPPQPAADSQAEPAPQPQSEPLSEPQPDSAPIAPDPEAEILRALAAYEAQLAEQHTRWLDASALRLGAAAARLDGAGTTRVLLHRGWIHNVAVRNPPAVLISTDPPTGPQAGDGLMPELAGTVRVFRSRGLRVAVHLWLRGRDMPPDIPGYITFSDERRIGTATYYLDHPRLGVILRSTAVGIPTDLQAAWAALKDPATPPAATPPPPTASPPS